MTNLGRLWVLWVEHVLKVGKVGKVVVNGGGIIGIHQLDELFILLLKLEKIYDFVEWVKLVMDYIWNQHYY